MIYYLTKKSIQKLAEDIVKSIKDKNSGDKPKPALKKQLSSGIESFSDYMGTRDSIMYSLLINIDEGWGTSGKKEIVILIDEDNVYVLDTPETKQLVNTMNEYFSKHTKTNECVYFTSNGKPVIKKSLIKGTMYFKYDYKDMKKFFAV